MNKYANKIKILCLSASIALLTSFMSGSVMGESGCLIGAICAGACNPHASPITRQECLANCRKTCEDRINGTKLPDGDPCSGDENCASGACALTQPSRDAQTRKRCCPNGQGKVFIFAQLADECKGMPKGAVCQNDATCASNNCNGGFFKLGTCE